MVASTVGVVLAGGRGSRLAPLTDTLPKQLLPAANEPILERILRQLAAAGIADVVVVLGDRGHHIRQAIGDGRPFGVAVAYVEQPGPLGIGDAVARCRPIVGDRRLCVVLGDCMIEHDIGADVRAAATHDEAARLLVAPVVDSERFGIVEAGPDGLVTGVVEKPRDYGPGMAISGVYLFDRRIFEALVDLPPSARGEVELTDAIARLIAGGAPVRAASIDGAWIDTGTLAGALEANEVAIRSILRATSAGAPATRAGTHPGVDPAARLVDSGVHADAVIAAGAEVSGCDIGSGVSIGRNCRLERCVVRNAIVMPGVVATDCVISGSIVGSGARISADLIDRIVAEGAVVGGLEHG